MLTGISRGNRYVGLILAIVSTMAIGMADIPPWIAMEKQLTGLFLLPGTSFVITKKVRLPRSQILSSDPPR